MTAGVDIPALPALVVGRLAHSRRGPIVQSFRHGVFQWLIDLDDVPALGRGWSLLGRFDVADHLSGRGADLKTQVSEYLAANGIELPEGRIVLLANARTFGYVFDPLSVYWCFAADGTLRCTIPEVHNTYGERHAYLLERDPVSPLIVDKEFYVSPFNDVSGRYRMRIELRSDRVLVSIRLEREEVAAFTAGFDGKPGPFSKRRLLVLWMRMPFMSQRVALLIRFHAIRLRLRRLPVQPRPEHRTQEGLR